MTYTLNYSTAQNMTIATSDITNASARVVIKHSMLKATREEQNLKSTPSSNGQGETRTEENKCNSITSRAEADRSRLWLLNHMKRLKAVETPPPERTEGTMRWKNMDNISGMVERGRNITNDTVIPDYIKYLKKMKDEERRSREAEYMTKYQRILMKTEITIGFLKVAIAAKGERVQQIKARSKPSMKEFCVSRVLHHYDTYKHFKNFVTSHDLNRNNQQILLKEFEKQINAPRVNADNSEERQ
jgi:hypothetical protein